MQLLLTLIISYVLITLIVPKKGRMVDLKGRFESSSQH